MSKENRVILKNVRCNFPRVHAPEVNQLSGKNEYSIVVLIPENDPQVAELKNKMQAVWVAKFGPEKGPKKLKSALDSKNTRFLHHDDENACYRINLKRREQDGAPMVLDRAKQPLAASSGLPYGGCYINVSFDLWVYDKQSTGTSATLLGVQFVKDGEPFGGSSQPSDKDFEDLSNDGTDSDPFAL